MKVLIDMNLSPAWVAVFESHGIEAIHWSGIGAADAPDEEIMHWARTNACFVFTHDLDFGSALALTKAVGPSVIQIRTQDIMPDKAGNTVISTVKAHWAELEQGSLLVIDERRARLRILPI